MYTGQQAGERSGYAAASAGDVNGDGFDDVIVGAFENSAATGRAYVFFGVANQPINRLVNSADLILTGESVGDQFGVSVGSAGDVPTTTS